MKSSDYKCPFDQLLIKPVQRVCRYPLFAKELLFKTINTNSEEYAVLKKAVEVLEDIVRFINGDDRPAKEREIILELGEKIRVFYFISNIAALILISVVALEKSIALDGFPSKRDNSKQQSAFRLWRNVESQQKNKNLEKSDLLHVCQLVCHFEASYTIVLFS